MKKLFLILGIAVLFSALSSGDALAMRDSDRDPTIRQNSYDEDSSRNPSGNETVVKAEQNIQTDQETKEEEPTEKPTSVGTYR